MSYKHHKPEEIIQKLRQVDVLAGQGMSRVDAVLEVRITEQTYCRWRKLADKLDPRPASIGAEIIDAQLKVRTIGMRRRTPELSFRLQLAFAGVGSKLPTLSLCAG